jgi:hypothetical protein
MGGIRGSLSGRSGEDRKNKKTKSQKPNPKHQIMTKKSMAEIQNKSGERSFGNLNLGSLKSI